MYQSEARTIQKKLTKGLTEMAEVEQKDHGMKEC